MEKLTSIYHLHYWCIMIQNQSSLWAFLFHDPSNVQKDRYKKEKKKTKQKKLSLQQWQKSRWPDAHPLDPVLMFQAGPGHQLATLGSSNEDPQIAAAAAARPGSERSEWKRFSSFLAFSQSEIFTTRYSSSFSSLALPPQLGCWSPPSSGRTGSRWPRDLPKTGVQADRKLEQTIAF